MKFLSNIEHIKDYLNTYNQLDNEGLLIYTLNGNDFYNKDIRNVVYAKDTYLINSLEEQLEELINDSTISWSRMYYTIPNMYNDKQIYLIDINEEVYNDVISLLNTDNILYVFDSPNGYHIITDCSEDILNEIAENNNINVISNERLFICLYNKDYTLYDSYHIERGPIKIEEDIIDSSILDGSIYDEYEEFDSSLDSSI